MASASRLLASALVGGMMVGSIPGLALAQSLAAPPVPPDSRVASFAVGSIQGVVQDDHGAPVSGAVVSALGASPTTCKP